MAVPSVTPCLPTILVVTLLTSMPWLSSAWTCFFLPPSHQLPQSSQIFAFSDVAPAACFWRKELLLNLVVTLSLWDSAFPSVRGSSWQSLSCLLLHVCRRSLPALWFSEALGRQRNLGSLYTNSNGICPEPVAYHPSQSTRLLLLYLALFLILIFTTQ